MFLVMEILKENDVKVMLICYLTILNDSSQLISTILDLSLLRYSISLAEV